MKKIVKYNSGFEDLYALEPVLKDKNLVAMGYQGSLRYGRMDEKI